MVRKPPISVRVMMYAGIVLALINGNVKGVMFLAFAQGINYLNESGWNSTNQNIRDLANFIVVKKDRE